MKENKKFGFLSLLVALFVCTSALFTACGSDDDSSSNTVTVNGKSTNFTGLQAVEGGGNVVLNLYAVSLSASGGKTDMLVFTIPTSLYGKTIELDKATPGDWDVAGTYISGDPRNLFDKGSTLFIQKTGKTYQIVFNLSKTAQDGSKTVVTGSYEGEGGFKLP